MLRRCALLLSDMSSVGGGRVQGLTYGIDNKRATIRPSIMDAQINQTALELKLSSLLAREMNETPEETIEAPLRRAWVRAPVSELSTSISRRDWFRLMSFNMMTDAWGPGRTTPVAAVRVRVPTFTRRDHASDGEADDAAFCDYDPEEKESELPPFLTPAFRRQHLVTLLRHYDPDIVCLNEVNRTFFNTEMWNYVRYLGYGNLYQSSRGARVKALRRGDVATAKSNLNKIPEHEDIGNVLLFHKGRFFPLMMPGRDLGRHFHFAHFVGLRDKVTNLTLYVACVQLTAGATPEAAQVRLHEAKQVLTLFDAMVRNGTERSHLTCVVCGDLNNETDDEPCVELLRDRFFSTHDVVGGPRWTAWHHRDDKRSNAYAPYYQKNVAEMHRFDGVYTAEEEIEKFRRTDTGYHGKSSRFSLVREEIAQKAAKKKASSTSATSAKDAASPPASLISPKEECAAKTTATTPPAPVDPLAITTASRKAKDVTFNTQDFIFYDPMSLALHQVLDTPEDAEVDAAQLFPNPRLPSHHLPLFVDLSWNDTYPDTLGRTLKD